MKTTYYTEDDVKMYLRKKMITGDTGDGVPNIFSDLDTLVTEGKRQTPVQKKKLAMWVEMTPEEFCKETKTPTKRYTLNKQLMDLSETPPELAQAIMNEYNSYKPAPRSKVLSYLIKKRMKLMLDCIGDF